MQLVTEGFVKRLGRYESKGGKPAQAYIKLGGMDDLQLLVDDLPSGIAEGDYVQMMAVGHVAYISQDRALVVRAESFKIVKKSGGAQ